MKSCAAILLLLMSPASVAAIKVAVASNFKSALTTIADDYQQLTGQKVLISSASTGILYNQIQHGAPFDLFLSADSERAALIEDSSKGIKGSRFTYAQGILAFWMPKDANVNQQSLLDYQGRLAIANPKLAPYGLASQQALQALMLWNNFSYVQGANISQTYQFIDSGNISAGLVAYALLLQNNETNYVLISNQLHEPILQQGVLLANSKKYNETQEFVDYLTSEPVKKLIRSKGYL
ncbi:MAG: molybdate ABC transporter substrate-binding protein [Psychromonas sp.]